MSPNTLRSVAFTLMVAVLTVSAQLKFQVMSREVIEQRLQGYKGNDSRREATLKAMFEASGCRGDNLAEQAVKGLKQPNLICVLPGTTNSTVVVGAHFDHVDAGMGVVDNWTGASMLPSLYQSLESQAQRRHTFLLIAFSGEEKGLVGSRFYVENLSPPELAKMRAMVDLDTLGLGPTEVWVSRSDPGLVNLLSGLAHAMRLPLTGVNVDRLGKSDEEYFIQRKVPTITIHSLTQETIPILHSPKDTYVAIRQQDYYDSYRLLSGYLALLDEKLPTDEVLPEKSTSK
jgi:hypothetical protein